MRRASVTPLNCLRCRFLTPRPRFFHSTARVRSSDDADTASTRPSTAPKPRIDIKHIRQNATLHETNCIERNYKLQSTYPARINELHQRWTEHQRDGRNLRERSNVLRKQIANPTATQGDEGAEAEKLRAMSKEELLAEAKEMKQRLAAIEESEARLTAEIEELALAIPNLTSDETPRGEEARVLSYINEHPEEKEAQGQEQEKQQSAPSSSDRVWQSHVHIGTELGLLDFAAASTTSGWGWYYLLDDGARLEQALIDFALRATRKHGWRQVTPPSIVYGHMAAACGFQPRDQHGETQSSALAQSAADRERGRPEMVLAGTAEIPLAAMKAKATLDAAELPLKRVGVSRCYRAEAGARGADTKGLYRVHEFNKVEMFAWTEPEAAAATEAFDEMLDIQTEILEMLGLHCRVLEMPSTDLGASATRKCDIEALFPSRRAMKNGGWGEVTSTSICTDYQTRRLATRVKTAANQDGGGGGGGLAYPWTVNGTALAVPRVLAAVLENGWDEKRRRVRLPECLWEAMGQDAIEMKQRRS